MAKVVYNDFVSEVHGKFCKNDPKGTIFARRKDTGTNYLYHVHNPFTGEPTAAQSAVHAKFRTASAETKRIMGDAELLASYRESFANQNKYKTIRGYIFAELMAAE